MSNKRTVPPYSEADATAWLAWLAYNMRRREMTIFQIESLQSDWLTGWKETSPHLLLTRTLWGVFAGLIFGLIFGPIEELISDLCAGLIFGLIFGLSEMVTLIHKIDAFLRTHTSRTKARVAWILIFGLSGGLIFGLNSRLSDGLYVGLTFALIFGLTRTSRVVQQEVGSGIRTIESVRWSWQHVRQNAGKGLIFGSILGLILGLTAKLSDGLFTPLLTVGMMLTIGLSSGLSFGLIFGLIGGLIGGFQPGVEELKTRPNQGIWLTLRSALKMGGLAGLIIGIVVGLLFQSIAVGLGYGSVTFLVIGGWYGGLDAIEHCIVRFILAWRGHAPLNYARFLDYAAEELNFLQKVGGGYIFIHRYLLEHFAEIAVEKGLVPEEEKK